MKKNRFGFKNITTEVIAGAVLIGLVAPLLWDAYARYTEAQIIPVVYAVEKPVAKEILIEVHINWTEDRIIEEIRAMFPEAPNTAVAIARCESGLRPVIQSHHILDYGREESYGVFQIHARDWHQTALRLGYTNYQTDPGENIKMARYLYDGRDGNFNDWTCYKTGMYKNYL